MSEKQDAIDVAADIFGFRSSNDLLRYEGRDFHERRASAVREMVAIMRKNGCQEVRLTENPEGYPLGLYLEGWSRKLSWPEQQGPFNYPLVSA